jgi:MurNAc alpha-1-phosphate uridylyltransferase
MKAMILAAGRGERMRPLTDTTPKPLLCVAQKPLIAYHLEKLSAIGITDVVINYAWLGEQIEAYCQQGQRWQLNISYSRELNGALETAGGIINALPLLNVDENEAFLVINADVFCANDFSSLPSLKTEDLAHLFLVENPEHNLQGDFVIHENRLQNINSQIDTKHYTFSGIGLYKPAFFKQVTEHKSVLPLAPLIRQNAEQHKIAASILDGYWFDIGTPARLQQINQQFGN